MKPAKILFFVDGPAPSNEDFAAAGEMKATVVFRNARAVPSEPHSLEICDGVAGKVPAIYAAKYPDAEKAIATKAAELKALSSKVGDTPAPKAKGNSNTNKTETAPQTPNTPPAGGTGEGTGTGTSTATGEGGKPPAWNPNPAK